MDLKLRMRLSILLLILPGLESEAMPASVSLTGTQSLTVSTPDQYSSVFARDQSQVHVVSGGSVASFDGFNTANLVLDDGHISYITLRNQASATLNPSADTSHFTALDNSRVVINGATISHVTALHGSEFLIRRGTISFLHSVPGKIRIEHIAFNGGIFSSGAVAVFGGALVYGPHGDVEIVGTFNRMDNGRLFGRWASGEPFSFWTISSSLDDSAGSGATYSLPTNLPSQIRFITAPVPEPTTYALMLVGLFLVGLTAQPRFRGTFGSAINDRLTRCHHRAPLMQGSTLTATSSTRPLLVRSGC
jgi:hypothetical protein